jgi:hypothetical protein
VPLHTSLPKNQSQSPGPLGASLMALGAGHLLHTPGGEGPSMLNDGSSARGSPCPVLHREEGGKESRKSSNFQAQLAGKEVAPQPSPRHLTPGEHTQGPCVALVGDADA